MSILYIGTFGSFIGYSFALPLVIKNTFPEFLAHHAFIANYLAGLAFIGALIGSLTRPLDRRVRRLPAPARVPPIEPARAGAPHERHEDDARGGQGAAGGEEARDRDRPPGLVGSGAVGVRRRVRVVRRNDLVLLHAAD